MLQFHGYAITSDAGLLASRGLDSTLQLIDTAPLTNWPTRAPAKTVATGSPGCCANRCLSGLPLEDVDEAERLYRDPAFALSGRRPAITGSAASASQRGRFETKWLNRPENLTALADLPGPWIDKLRRWRSPKTIVLDIDLSESADLRRAERQHL